MKILVMKFIIFFVVFVFFVVVVGCLKGKVNVYLDQSKGFVVQLGFGFFYGIFNNGISVSDVIFDYFFREIGFCVI